MLIGIDCSRAFVDDRTGTENYSYEIVRHILRLPESRKHQFVLFTRPGAIIPDWIRVSNSLVAPIAWKYLWTQAGLASETWRYKLDVLWIPAHTLPILRKPDLKTVVTIHGMEYRWLPEYRNVLQRWYLPLSTRYAAHTATRLIAVSEFTKGQLVKELAVDPRKITVIHEGVEFSESANLPTQAGRRIGESAGTVCQKYQIIPKKYILFVGTVQPRKNLEALIEAFSLIASRYPDYTLVIAGGKGWMTESIYQAPHRYQIAERVIFLGRVADSTLAVLYSQASVYVQPSLQEGFGLPVIEAMRYGVPVVSSDGGALPEVVGTAGLVIPLGNGFSRQLADGLVRVLADKSLRARLIKAGKDRVHSLNWQRAAEKTLDILISQ